MQDTDLRARVASELKEGAEKIFQVLGLTTAEVIRMYFVHGRLRGGQPFAVTVPSDNDD